MQLIVEEDFDLPDYPALAKRYTTPTAVRFFSAMSLDLSTFLILHRM
jgi:hypothetical protein